jgi:hypothetical protein
MLGKLLKYEIRDTARIIPFFYLIAAILTAASLISGKLELGWFKVTSSVLLILAGIAVVIIAFVIVIMRFYKNLYTNEGYLSFTLPVKPHLHLVSKTLVSFGWMIISMLAGIGAVTVGMYGLGVDKNVWNIVMDELNKYGLNKLIFIFIPMICFSILYLLGQIFFAITLANRPAFHSMGGVGASILLFLATNVALQIVETILTIIVPFSLDINVTNGLNFSLSSKNMVGFMIQNVNNPNPGNIVVGLGGYLFEVIAVCALFYMTGRMMSKKVSLR